MKTTTSTSAYRSILQDIVCDRFADDAAALAEIKKAFEAGQLGFYELRNLESARSEMLQEKEFASR